MKSISVKEYPIRRVQSLLEDGQFAIPELQREFVWNGRKAAALLDSVVRRLPVGMPLVWKTGRENKHLLRNKLNVLPPHDDRNKTIWFLIDGQQRLSVLHRVRIGDQVTNSNGNVVDFRRVVLDVGARNGAPRIIYNAGKDANHIPIPDLLGRSWSRRERKLTVGRRSVAREYRRRLLTYPIPIMFAESAKVEEVRECFIRINSLGTPVSAADRAFARASEFDLRHLVEDLRASLAPGFRRVSPLPLLLGIALIEGEREVGQRAVEGMIRRLEGEATSSPGGSRAFSRKWRKYRTSVGKAVDCFRTQLDVPGVELLYSDNMLAVLALFFYFNARQPTARQRRELRKWFWATAVGQRYTGQGYRVNIARDVEFMKRLARVGNARFVFSDLVPVSELRRVSYSRHSGMSVAFECLLRKNRPRYIDNGEPIPLDEYSTSANRGDRHHIYPKAQLAACGVPAREYNSICNICLIVAEENQAIGRSRPYVYLEHLRTRKHFASAMRSHLIPCGRDDAIWDRHFVRGFRRFLLERQNVIARALEKQAGMRLFRKA